MSGFEPRPPIMIGGPNLLRLEADLVQEDGRPYRVSLDLGTVLTNFTNGGHHQVRRITLVSNDGAPLLMAQL